VRGRYRAGVDGARFFRSASEFRRWLERHHEDASELWIGFHKAAAGRRGLAYPAAVEEALCFGWIDGHLRPIDEGRYRVRFSPRRRGSNWSAVNIARMRELIAAGRVAPAGIRAFECRHQSEPRDYSYELGRAALSPAETSSFRLNRKAWAFWEAQTATYRKHATFWVVSPKRVDTRERRFRQLVERSAAAEPIPPLRFGHRVRPAKPG
jgi:uncharacterized protein YdeI (YjbR/CyaY-like superfamily)